MRRTLLFVDDDQDIRDAIGDLLEFAGFAVMHASNGAEGLAWLAANPAPAAILLDLKMPVCDGYEFRRRQLADPRLAAIPTIALTADERAFDSHERASIAGLPVLRKPIEIDDLLPLLTR